MGNGPTPEELRLSNWIDGEPRSIKSILAIPSDKRLVLSVTEVAELLGVSTGTVRLYTRKGWLFAPDTFGGRVLITKASLERFLTVGPTVPTPDPVSPTRAPSVSPPPVRRTKATGGGFNLAALRGRGRNAG